MITILIILAIIIGIIAMVLCTGGIGVAAVGIDIVIGALLICGVKSIIDRIRKKK